MDSSKVQEPLPLFASTLLLPSTTGSKDTSNFSSSFLGSCWTNNLNVARSSSQENLILSTLQGSGLSIYSIENNQQCLWSFSLSPSDSPFTCRGVMSLEHENVFAFTADEMLHSWNYKRNTHERLKIPSSSGVFDIIPIPDFGLVLLHNNGQIDVVSLPPSSLNDLIQQQQQRKLELIKSWNSKLPHTSIAFCQLASAISPPPSPNSSNEQFSAEALFVNSHVLVRIVKLGTQFFYETISMSLEDGIKVTTHIALDFSETPSAFAFAAKISPAQEKLYVIYPNRELHVLAISNSKGTITRTIKVSLDKYLAAPFVSKKGSKKNNVVVGVSMCALSSGCLALVSQASNAKIYLTMWDGKYGTLQLESELYTAANSEEEESSEGRSGSHIFISNTTSASYGNVLAISLVNRTAKKGKYSCHLDLFPYHCAPVSLLAALGRISAKEESFNTSTFKGQLSTVIPIAPPALVGDKTKPLNAWKAKVSAWEVQEGRYLQELLLPASTPTVQAFQEKFIDWIAQKLVVLRNWTPHDRIPAFKRSKFDGNSTSLLQMPVTDLSQHAISSILGRCFKSPKSFWPRAVVEYLICTGSVSSEMTQSLEGGNISNEDNTSVLREKKALVGRLLQIEEISLIEMCFKHVTDLDERDYVSVLKYVCFLDSKSSSRESCHSWWSAKALMPSQPKKGAKSGDDSEDNVLVLENSDNTLFGIDLNQGEKALIQMCFSAPRVDAVFTKELSSLSVPQLHIILAWLKEIILPQFDSSPTLPSSNEKSTNNTDNIHSSRNKQHRKSSLNISNKEKFPLWWLWYDQPFDGHHKQALDGEYEKWQTALEALALVVDAHLPTLRLSSQDGGDNLQVLFAEMSFAVKRDINLLSLYESRLRGPLLATIGVGESEIQEGSSSSKNNKGSQSHGGKQGGRRNWKNLVKQMELGVGQYSIEILQL